MPPRASLTHHRVGVFNGLQRFWLPDFFYSIVVFAAFVYVRRRCQWHTFRVRRVRWNGRYFVARRTRHISSAKRLHQITVSESSLLLDDPQSPGFIDRLLRVSSSSSPFSSAQIAPNIRRG